VLAFYLRPDVQTVFSEYEAHFGVLYDKIVGATNITERDTKRLSQEGYVEGFGKSTELIPDVFDPSVLQRIFKTIVNERVDYGSDRLDPALASVN